MRIQESVWLDRDREAVYAYLADFANVRDWDPSVVAARRLTGGPPAPGTRFALVLAMGPRRVPMTYRLAAAAAPRHLVFEGRGASFTARDTLVLAAESGGTRLDYRVDLDLTGAAPAALRPFLGLLVRINARRAIRRLRTVLGGGRPTPRLSAWTRFVDRSVVLAMPGFTVLGYHLGRRRRPYAGNALAGRTVVLTGGTAGIGRAAAGEIHRLGADLVVVGRDSAKLRRVQEEIVAAGGPGRCDVETADLSRLSEVRALARRLAARLDGIDVLVNNAGALFDRHARTDEGVERTLALDLLAPYLLTESLRPLLARRPGARVVNVSSGGMYTQGIDPARPEPEPEGFDGATAYARCKRGLVALTEWWARQWDGQGIRVHAMHPGWVDTPGLRRSLPAFHHRLRRWLRTPAQGADTIVWLAAAPDAGRTSGLFWLDRRPRATEVFPGTGVDARGRRRLAAALGRLADRTGVHAADRPAEIRPQARADRCRQPG